MTRALLLFALAAVFEIAGCFAFWSWLRRDAVTWWLPAGTLSLVAFALTLAQVDEAFAGRAFAAYGGIYLAASLAWLWMIEGQRPTASDTVGAAITVLGAALIIGFGSPNR